MPLTPRTSTNFTQTSDALLVGNGLKLFFAVDFDSRGGHLGNHRLFSSLLRFTALKVSEGRVIDRYRSNATIAP